MPAMRLIRHFGNEIYFIGFFFGTNYIPTMHNEQGLQCFQRSFEIWYIPLNDIITDKVHMFKSDVPHFTVHCYMVYILII